MNGWFELFGYSASADFIATLAVARAHYPNTVAPTLEQLLLQIMKDPIVNPLGDPLTGFTIKTARDSADPEFRAIAFYCQQRGFVENSRILVSRAPQPFVFVVWLPIRPPYSPMAPATECRLYWCDLLLPGGDLLFHAR